MRERTAVTLLFPLLALTTGMVPQQPSPPTAASLGDITAGAGLQVLDGELCGVGTAYKIRFAAHGFELTPVLGAAAPRSMPLRFTLLSVGRGDAAVPQGEVAPVREGDLRVAYRCEGLSELYDLRPDGVEQSFRFEALPLGVATWSCAAASLATSPRRPTATGCASTCRRSAAFASAA